VKETGWESAYTFGGRESARAYARVGASVFGEDKKGGRKKCVRRGATVDQFRRFCLLFEGSGGFPNVHSPSL